MKKKIIALLLAVCFVLTMLVSCAPKQTTGDGPSSNDGEKKHVTIGNLTPLSGDNAENGEQQTKVIQMWVDQINAQGGLLGEYIIDLVSYDDQADPSEAVLAVNKLLAENENLICVIGTQMSSCMISVAELFRDAQIPVLAGGMSPSWIELGYDYVWRSAANQNFDLEALCLNIQKMGIDKVGLFHVDDDANQAAGDHIVEFLDGLGIEVVNRQSCTSEDTDFSGQCTAIVNAKPDAVIICSNFPQLPYFAKCMRDLGYDGVMFAKDIVNYPQYEQAGSDINYTISCFPTVTFKSPEDAERLMPGNTMMPKFLQDFKDKYGEVPSIEACYRAYDACLGFEHAIEIAQSVDPVEINKALYQVAFDGIQGRFDYTSGSHEGMSPDAISGWIFIDGENLSLQTWLEKDFEAWKETVTWNIDG